MTGGGSEGHASVGGGAEGEGGDAGGEEAGASRVQHPRSFKLRFAAQREPGRSYVSLVKPLGLPATVTGKFYARPQAAEGEAAGEARALLRIGNMFAQGPREKYEAPVTGAHEYGWWAKAARAQGRGDPRLDHRIRDSAWLKSRMLVLAADEKLKQK